MVTKNQVYEAADALQKAGKSVNQRAAIEWLQRHPRYPGASPRDLGPFLKAWKEERNYLRVIENAGLPEAVQGVLNKAVIELWHQAKKAAAIDVADHRHELEEAHRDLDAANLQIEKLRKDVAVMEPENCRIRTENVRLGEENARLRAELDAAEERLRKVRANEFWDRVMRELHTLMPHGAWLTVDEIEPLVPRHLVGESRGHAEEWSTTTLRKKLDQRVHWDKYFAKDKAAKRYSRLAEAA